VTVPREDEDGFGSADAIQLTGVDADAVPRIEAFLDLLWSWRTRINLIGPGEGRHLWRRHVLDSLQLAPLIPGSARSLADLGSGAGFPGIILCCARPDLKLWLVEKSVRKSEFLTEAVTALRLQAIVLNQRIEDLAPEPADVVTARALAPLPKLLGLSKGWLSQEGRALFLKGRDVAAELTEARLSWTFDLDVRPSLSSPDGQVLTISALRRTSSG
jgi:16S rRNA (guanine527-N7)-methyltransferase